MESRIKSGLTGAVVTLLVGLAVTPAADAGMARGQFLVSVTVVNSCQMGRTDDNRLARYTGFGLSCSRGTDYTVQVASDSDPQRNTGTDASGVTSVTVRF